MLWNRIGGTFFFICANINIFNHFFTKFSYQNINQVSCKVQDEIIISITIFLVFCLNFVYNCKLTLNKAIQPSTDLGILVYNFSYFFFLVTFFLKVYLIFIIISFSSSIPLIPSHKLVSHCYIINHLVLLIDQLFRDLNESAGQFYTQLMVWENNCQDLLLH